MEFYSQNTQSYLTLLVHLLFDVTYNSQGLVVVCLISPKKVQDPTLWEKPFLFIFGRKMVVFSPSVSFVLFCLLQYFVRF